MRNWRSADRSTEGGFRTGPARFRFARCAVTHCVTAFRAEGDSSITSLTRTPGHGRLPVPHRSERLGADARDARSGRDPIILESAATTRPLRHEEGSPGGSSNDRPARKAGVSTRRPGWTRPGRTVARCEDARIDQEEVCRGETYALGECERAGPGQRDDRWSSNSVVTWTSARSIQMPASSAFASLCRTIDVSRKRAFRGPIERQTRCSSDAVICVAAWA